MAIRSYGLGGFLAWLSSKNEYSLSESSTKVLIEECKRDFPLKTRAYFAHITEIHQFLKRECLRN